MKKVIALALSALMLIGMTACGSETTETTQPTTPISTTTAVVTVPTVPAIDKDLSSVLTKQEIVDILGVEMQDPIISGRSDSIICYSVESGKASLLIDVKEQTAEHFYNATVMHYPDYEDAPNLCEIAFYSRSAHQLLCYNEGYVFTIDLNVNGVTTEENDANLLMCREIALLILSRF